MVVDRGARPRPPVLATDGRRACPRRWAGLPDGRRPGLLVPPDDAGGAGRRAAALADATADARGATTAPDAAARTAAPASLAGWSATTEAGGPRARRGGGARDAGRAGLGACSVGAGGPGRCWCARLGHRPVPRRACARSTPVVARWRRSRSRSPTTVVRRLAVARSSRAAWAWRSRCAARSPPTTARSCSTPRCPAASSATCTAACGTAATSRQTGRGLRAVGWERLAGQVVQVAVAVVVLVAAALAGPLPRCRRGARRRSWSWLSRWPLSSWPARVRGVAAAPTCARVARRRALARRRCCSRARGRVGHVADVPGRRPDRRRRRRRPLPAAAAGAAGAAGDGGAGEHRRLGAARGRGGLGVRRGRARRRRRASRPPSCTASWRCRQPARRRRAVGWCTRTRGRRRHRCPSSRPEVRPWLSAPTRC